MTEVVPGSVEYNHHKPKLLALRTMIFKTITAEDLIGPMNEFEQRNAPRELFARGDTEILRYRNRVSIVGSRDCSKAGALLARRFAALLVSKDVVIVSGLAKGIDSAAHHEVLKLRGKTVGVIGTPLDKCYPAENRQLQERIATEQLLISQFPIGMRTYPSSFPQRNRTMALLSDATLIVEAGDSSGSLSQGWEAIRLGRPLWISHLVEANPKLSWPKEMIRYGAVVLDEEILKASEDGSEAGLDDLLAELPIHIECNSDQLQELIDA